MKQGKGQGGLAKMRLEPVEVVDGTTRVIDRPPLGAVVFHYNPERIRWSLSIEWTGRADQATESHAKTFGGGRGRTVRLERVVFDTFASRRNVRTEVIDALEALAQRDHRGDHPPPFVRLLWGRFSGEADAYNLPLFVVERLDITYAMFLPDGTPVRAFVDIELLEATPPELQQALRPNQSPDHERRWTVRQGDTLRAVALAAYGDGRLWRFVADANDLDDPLHLEPGRVLRLPPWRP